MEWAYVPDGTRIGILGNVGGSSDPAWNERNRALQGNEVYLGADGNFQLVDSGLYEGVGQEIARRSAPVGTAMEVMFVADVVIIAAPILAVETAGSGIATLGLDTAGTSAARTTAVQASRATMQAFERQLAQYGRTSLEKSLRKLERRLAKHLADIEKYRQAGGYTSSLEREVKIFRESIAAIKEILRR